MRRPEPITILGTDGTGDWPGIGDLWGIVIPEAMTEFPDFDIDTVTRKTPWGEQPHPHATWCVDRIKVRMFAWPASKTHNELVPLVNALADLRRDADHAVAEAAAHHDDLNKNTTINWLATHHRYVQATIRAHDLLGQVADLTADLAGRKPDILTPGNLAHDLVYTVHVPEDQRLVLPTAADADAARLAVTEFVERSTTQLGILAATITGTYPPGFAPANDPAPTARERATAALAGDDWPINPAITLADQAMRVPGPRPGDPEAPARSW